MKRIIYTSLSGLPFEDSGGPNKVINQLLSKINTEEYEVFFLSKNAFFQHSVNSNIISIPRNYKFRITQKLFNINKLYRKAITSSIYLKRFFNKSIRTIKEKLEFERWEILHAHDIRTLFNLERKKGKIILTIHSKGSIVNDMMQLYGNRKSLHKIYNEFSELEKKALEIADVITFPSIAAKDLYYNDLNTFKYDFKTKVIYNGIDLQKIDKINPDLNFFKKWDWIKKYDFRILTVGAHIKAKNIDLILKTFSLLNKLKPNKCHLICVGSGFLTDELKKMSRALGIFDNVSFISYLANDDIIKLMKTCNIYLSLSNRVIFDLVILEALACGMYVIASNDGGNKEIINNSNGILVELNNLDLIVQEILNYYSYVKDMDTRIIQNFSLEKTIKDYYQLYEQQ